MQALKNIIATAIDELGYDVSNLEDLKDLIIEKNGDTPEEKIIVWEKGNEVLYLADYSSLNNAIWECIHSNLTSS